MAGLGAWLLGTLTATTGSMVAVNVLAHHLLDPQTLQLAGTTISADPDPESPSPAPSVTPTPRSTKPAARGSAAPTLKSSAASSQPTPNSAAGTLLVFADGSVMATCESAGAYLLYWSPDQGFSVPADDVRRGPADVASVLFRGQSGSYVMRVTCSGGTPVAHVYPANDGDDGGGSGGGPSGSPSGTPSGTPTDE